MLLLLSFLHKSKWKRDWMIAAVFDDDDSFETWLLMFSCKENMGRSNTCHFFLGSWFDKGMFRHYFFSYSLCKKICERKAFWWRSLWWWGIFGGSLPDWRLRIWRSWEIPLPLSHYDEGLKESNRPNFFTSSLQLWKKIWSMILRNLEKELEEEY